MFDVFAASLGWSIVASIGTVCWLFVFGPSVILEAIQDKEEPLVIRYSCAFYLLTGLPLLLVLLVYAGLN